MISIFYFGYLSDIQISEQILDNLVIVVIAEALIGLSLGLTLTIWFAAASLAGEKIAATTGLGFSQMVDPDTGGQTPVISLILDLFLITIFLSLNGHLIAIEFLFKSFEIFNINDGIPPFGLVGLGIEAAGAMFYTGGLIMLPVVGALFTNKHCNRNYNKSSSSIKYVFVCIPCNHDSSFLHNVFSFSIYRKCICRANQ